MKKNIIVNVNLHGGWSCFFKPPKTVLQNILDNYNNQGYNYVEALPSKTAPFFFIKQIIFAICTIGYYIPIPTFMFIFEKEVDREWKEAIIKQAEQNEYKLLK